MAPAARMTAAGRASRTAVILGAALFVSYAYFYQAGGWNQNSRFALVRAVLERHTLQIDAYRLHTNDIAVFDGHYYSDKAPGTSLLALAPVAAAKGLARLAGVDPGSFPGIAWTSYAGTVATSGVFTVIAALAVMWVVLQWGYSRGAALFAATAYGVASPAWCYATLFMEHGVAAGCLMLAFAAVVALDLNRSAKAFALPPDRNDRGVDDRSAKASAERLAWVIGLAAGWAVVSELQAAVPAAFIVGLALLSVRDGRPEWSLAVIGRLALAAGAAAIVLFAFNTLAFASPFHLGYSSEQGFEQMRRGFFGITYPEAWRLRAILFGSYRGLLPIAPLIALTPVGLYVLARTPRSRRAAIVACLVALFYLLLNASYYYWEGGWAFGPRQLTPGLPFAALGLAPLWDGSRRAGRIVLAGGWIWGTALMLVAVSTTPQPPSTFKSPVRELLWPAFKDGDLSLNPQTFVHISADAGRLRGNQVPHAAWNLGEIAGLHGLWSLAPLAFIWILAVAALLL